MQCWLNPWIMAHVFWGVDISRCGHKCASCRCTWCRGSSEESGSLYTAVLSLQDRYSAARTTAATRSHSSSVSLQSSVLLSLSPVLFNLQSSSVFSLLQSSSPWPPWPATRWRRCWRRRSTRGRAPATAGAGPPRTPSRRGPTPSGWPQVRRQS